MLHPAPGPTTFLSAGVDEAGRGPLAGPVAVAAVILDPGRPLIGLDDSKKLSEKKRIMLYSRIVERALAYCVILVDVEDIDRRGILQATLVGMNRAIAGLSRRPDQVLIDGNTLPSNLSCPGQAIVGGDALEPAISAASILAKVSRDRLMLRLEQRYPGYGFALHKGYSTRNHLIALKRLGPCPQHRRSFAPVRAMLEKRHTSGHQARVKLR